MCRLRINAVDENSLFPVRKIRAEPGEGSVRDAKGMLESSKKNSMVNGVEGCREIKECEERNFAGVIYLSNFQLILMEFCCSNMLG